MVYGTMGSAAGPPGERQGGKRSDVHAESAERQDRASPLAAAASLQLSASAASDTHTT